MGWRKGITGVRVAAQPYPRRHREALVHFEKGQWLFEFHEEWSQLVSKYNWYTCTLCRIEFENDAILGAYEATAILIGIGLRVRWNHTRTETMDEIERRVAELDDT
jgi:hypothetical protein